MNNYLLTIIGEIKSEKMCEEIALSISPIVDSSNLKFQHKNGVLLMHFGTEIDKDEVYEYIKGILYGVIDTFILSEMSDKVSVFMPEDTSKHLFDLDNIDDDVNMRLEIGKVIFNQIDTDEDVTEEYLPIFLEALSDLVKKPSLDQLLDKISNQGYSSLTQFEKDILETYSKI